MGIHWPWSEKDNPFVVGNGSSLGHYIPLDITDDAADLGQRYSSWSFA